MSDAPATEDVPVLHQHAELWIARKHDGVNLNVWLASDRALRSLPSRGPFSDYVQQQSCEGAKIKCDATNMIALDAYSRSNDPKHRDAYDCIISHSAVVTNDLSRKKEKPSAFTYSVSCK